MLNIKNFQANLAAVRARMSAACAQAERSESEVALLPVTKNHPVAAIEYAARSGLCSVGEHRVQEASYKQDSCKSEVRWELIGHLQSNKAKLAVGVFDRIQTVDSLKLLRRLDRFASEAGKTLPILIQCNSGEDPNKYGFPLTEMAQAVECALEASALRLDGFMTIAPLDDDPDVAKSAFEKLRNLRDELSGSFNCALDELSMGMTGDLEAAIAAGSTQIRVGTALYGSREA